MPGKATIKYQWKNEKLKSTYLTELHIPQGIENRYPTHPATSGSKVCSWSRAVNVWVCFGPRDLCWNSETFHGAEIPGFDLSNLSSGLTSSCFSRDGIGKFFSIKLNNFNLIIALLLRNEPQVCDKPVSIANIWATQALCIIYTTGGIRQCLKNS